MKGEVVAETFDPEAYLHRAEQIFDCDINRFVHTKRLSGTDREIRNMLLYSIWKTGQFKNEQIGNLFGISYSGVSHAVKSTKHKYLKSRKLKKKLDQLNSQFKL